LKDGIRFAKFLMKYDAVAFRRERQSLRAELMSTGGSWGDYFSAVLDPASILAGGRSRAPKPERAAGLRRVRTRSTSHSEQET